MHARAKGDRACLQHFHGFGWANTVLGRRAGEGFYGVDWFGVRERRENRACLEEGGQGAQGRVAR